MQASRDRLAVIVAVFGGGYQALNALLLGAEHPVASELVAVLTEARLGLYPIELPSLEQAPPDSVLEEIGAVLPDVVFFTPQVPLSRLSFRRRLHLVDSVKKLCAAVARKNVPFFHLSSVHVYDGKLQRPYTEDDKPNPASDFAKVWRRWETIVERQFRHNIILRPGWLLGGDHTYISSSVKQALGYHAAPDKVAAAKGNPVAPEEIARVMFALLRQLSTGAHNYGIFHLAGKDVLSAETVLNSIAPDSYLQVDDEMSALQYELDCSRIRNAYGVQQRHWAK